MEKPALQSKRGVVLQMAFLTLKVFGTFEKRPPGYEDIACGSRVESRPKIPQVCVVVVVERERLYFINTLCRPSRIA